MSNLVETRRPLLTPLLAGVACVLALSGCGEDDTSPNNPVLACDRKNHHSCIDYSNAFSQVEAADACDASVLQGPCGPNDVVGSCQVNVSGFLLTEVYYASAWTAATAEQECTSGGGTFK